MTARVLPALATATFILLITWGLARIARRLVRASAAHLADRTARFVAQQFAYYAAWAVGFAVMFTAVGLDPQAVVTGLGLTGVALGFALKEPGISLPNPDQRVVTLARRAEITEGQA